MTGGASVVGIVALAALLSVPAHAAQKEKAPPGMVEVDGRYFPDFAPLPPVPYPADNPPSSKKEDLGKTLFFDKNLSRDRAMSCSTCHDPKLDFGDRFDRAHGRDDKVLLRRTRSLKNVAYNRTFFWDGRAPSLEAQFFVVLQNHDEMDMDPRELASRLRESPAYRGRFEEVFPGEGISTRTISYAIAAYERTLRVGDSVFDEYLRGDARDMVKPNYAGMKLFKGKARCIVCHNGPTLSDGKFHNTGLRPRPDGEEDLGRERIDRLASSRRSFRTPMLRNSSHNTPYFHDGSIGPIERLLEFYNQGGQLKEGLDPDIRPLHLTRVEILQLKSFLYTLGEKDYDHSRDKYEHRLSAQEEAVYRQ